MARRSRLIVPQEVDQDLPLLRLSGGADSRGFLRQLRRSVALDDLQQSRQPAEGEIHIELLEQGSAVRLSRRCVRRQALRHLLLQREYVPSKTRALAS